MTLALVDVHTQLLVSWVHQLIHLSTGPRSLLSFFWQVRGNSVDLIPLLTCPRYVKNGLVASFERLTESSPERSLPGSKYFWMQHSSGRPFDQGTLQVFDIHQ